MTRVSLCLLAFGIADVARWSPEAVSIRRSIWAGVAVIAADLALELLAGFSGKEILPTTPLLGLIGAIWLGFDHSRWAGEHPDLQLAFVSAVLLVAVGVSGSGPAAHGPLDHWYMRLPLARGGASTDQFLLAAAALVFALFTANRIVRLVLQASSTGLEQAEASLRGGRLLGAMERIFVGAMILAGNLAAAAALIAAKGLLRLPEIRSSADQSRGTPDQVTEYFLIGTFASLLLAGALGALVLAAR